MPIVPKPPSPCCRSSVVDIPSSPEVFQNISIKKGVLRCKFCEKPFHTSSGLSSHLKKIHHESLQEYKTKLFPSPKENGSYVEPASKPVEDGPLSDHCRSPYI
ncbi:hypothetical protein NPIL_487431 [Nephila pilipes]|uniref:C2H2-type domain-containing protein n=1 Tax=Nephila pilipes TaxID=299642 RepID=A0A8X6TTP3_NEPPI|nr:hypothetical protein NPIL_487431 [Nephila pilipes]